MVIQLQEDSPYFLANLKNRRVLGNQSKSISFRTHENVPEKHTQISLDVEYHDDIITLHESLLAVLTRLWICGDYEYSDSGKSFCMNYDTDQLIALGLLPDPLIPLEKYSVEKQALFYDSAAISNYYNYFPKIISFRLLEYEKQVLYLKGLTDGFKVVEVLRNLYHADTSQFNILRYTDNTDLILGLMCGLSERVLRELISFHSYPSNP